MRQTTTWIVGDFDHAELAPAVGWLREHSRSVQSSSAEELLCAVGPESLPPDAIVLAAARPGRLHAREVELLHRREPLAPLVGLLGSLCEGEVRSGRPWPGVTRINWHQWRSRLPAAVGIIEALAADRTWTPRTASDVDAAQRVIGLSARRQEALIAICTPRLTVYESLADACAAVGYRSLWQMPHLPLQARGVDLMLVDGETATTLDSATAQGLPRVHLLDFPRLDDYESAIATGAAAVVSKPFLLSDLHSGIAVALANRAQSSHRVAAA